MRDALAVSLNEIESLSAKAARGAGAPWGVAEEVGRATRWMAERGFAWSPALLRLLEGGDVATHLRTACHAADLLAGRQGGDELAVAACEPLWLLPILSAALRGRDLTLDCTWAGCAVRLKPDGGFSAAGPLPALEAAGRQAIVVAITGAMPDLSVAIVASARRGAVSPIAWAAFERFAARTYVPASHQSRAGAGGGGVDAE